MVSCHVDVEAPYVGINVMRRFQTKVNLVKERMAWDHDNMQDLVYHVSLPGQWLETGKPITPQITYLRLLVKVH